MCKNSGYIQEAGDWLGRYDWQYFGTLTFAQHNATLNKAKYLFQEFIQGLGTGILYFVVFERFRSINTYHLHVLLGGVQKEVKWKYGVSEITLYDRSRGGRFYVAKYLQTGLVEWDCNLPTERSCGMKIKRDTPLRAIRKKCLRDCSNGQRSEVRFCLIPECAIYPYRFGKNPYRKGIGGKRRSVPPESAS